MVRTSKGLTLAVRCPDLDVAGLRAGEAVRVEGILREIRSESSFVLMGLAIARRNGAH